MIVESPKLDVKPLDTTTSFRNQAYAAIKDAITAANIYAHPTEIRLDERQLSQALGVSRTPIREAMTLLEQEGFLRTLPRRGVFIIRKTKREIVEMIQVWAALESMAARLATQHASDAEILRLHAHVDKFSQDEVARKMGEYSDANIKFHQAIIGLGKCPLIAEICNGLFMHMRAIRQRTIFELDRAKRSIVDHTEIVNALETRETERAERLVREHTLRLRDHVERFVELD